MKYKKKIASGVLLLLIISILFAPAVDAGENAGEKVLLGGVPFGVSFRTGEVKIGGFSEIETEKGMLSPARDAGLCKDDIIKEVNGKSASSAYDVTAAVKGSEGNAVELLILRGQELSAVKVVPVLCSRTGEYLIGILIEDGSAGLGTVTYIEKESGGFGGLGHGIVDSKSGELCRIKKGIVSYVTVEGVTKGEAGKPGELRGEFHSEKLGVVNKNSDCGVFGFITEYPESYTPKEIEIGKKSKIRNGGASIFSTVDSGGVQEYSVEITCLDNSEEGNKNFLITVTDTKLIEKTGGIVRGMSGSPVVQDGMLIGAVTHVMVNDPTVGYGIFIENMMDNADLAENSASRSA